MEVGVEKCVQHEVPSEEPCVIGVEEAAYEGGGVMLMQHPGWVLGKEDEGEVVEVINGRGRHRCSVDT